MNRWRTSTFVLAAVVGVLLVQAAFAGGGPTVTSVSGKGATRTKIIRSIQQQATSSATFVPIPGIATTISVPAGTRAIIKVEFFARSFCFGINPRCAVRIRIGGANAHPNNWDLPFDAGESNNDHTEAHATQGSSNVLGTGSYTVRVQWKVDDAANSFSIDGFSMSVERIRV
ncbi:MAG: hypothetical protein ACRDIX_07815 [Actinomycetota bacterium]